MFFKKANTENKLCFVVGDFNLHCLDYKESLEIRNVLKSNLIAHGCILLITKPTRVTLKIVYLIDNMFKKFIFDTYDQLE